MKREENKFMRHLCPYISKKESFFYFLSRAKQIEHFKVRQGKKQAKRGRGGEKKTKATNKWNHRNQEPYLVERQATKLSLLPHIWEGKGRLSSLLAHTSTNCKSHFYPPLKDSKDTGEGKIYSKGRHIHSEKKRFPSFDGVWQKSIFEVLFIMWRSQMFHRQRRGLSVFMERMCRFGIDPSMCNPWEYWKSIDNNKSHPVRDTKEPDANIFFLFLQEKTGNGKR